MNYSFYDSPTCVCISCKKYNLYVATEDLKISQTYNHRKRNKIIFKSSQKSNIKN